jgi:hypothetical protein
MLDDKEKDGPKPKPKPTPFRVGFSERLRTLALAPALDVHVTDHCNLRCRGCVHFAPLAQKHFLDLDDYEADLKALAAIPGIESYFRGLYLMGGDPLLHPRIEDVITLTRRLLPRVRIVLASNGILLGRMGDDFWDALDSCGVELQLSAYPINMDYDGLVEMAKARVANVDFAMDLTGLDAGKAAFLKVAIDPEGEQDPIRSFNSCFFGGNFMQLSDGSIWNCQVAAHHATLDAAFGWMMTSEPADKLPLSSIASIDDIESFRRSAHPMCRYCANDRMGIVTWCRSRRDEREWRA